ncbi:energy transducer TonB [Niabella hirudinis]|uniref:energy transducer TonB n=1 Tax=Niabella hirudinis TaxID=1285929 RepID=UPI003EB8EFA0
MKTILAALIMLVSLPLNGQNKRYAYYLDVTLSPTQKQNAFIYGKGVKQDSAVWVDFHLVLNDQKLFSAAYTDSSLQVLHGKSIDYYPNGNIQQMKSYVFNVQEGLTQKWDSMGRQTDSIIYKKGAVAVKKTFRYSKGNIILNEIITDSVLNTMQDIRYDTTGHKLRAFVFSGNTGIEKIYRADGSVTNGDSLYTREDKEAAFPGGPKAWRAYLTRALDAKVPIKNGAPEGRYQVMVKFIVDKDGRLLDIKAISSNGYGMENEAVGVIRGSGKWTPAQKYGRSIKAYKMQPITFAITANNK